MPSAVRGDTILGSERLFNFGNRVARSIAKTLSQGRNSAVTSSDGPGEWERPDDRFIPLRPADLAHRLVSDAGDFALAGDDVLAVAHALEIALDRETAALQRTITDDYTRFNPDRDTLPSIDEHGDPATSEYEQLFAQISQLLDKANYDRLSDVQIEQAVLRASRRSLHVRVHPDRIEHLEVWIRGRGTSQRQLRNWWRPWQMEDYTIEVFRRMVVVAQLKDSSHVVLKLFKDIPEAEVEALLPHAEATMSLFDRIKLFGASAGTLGITASKVLNVAIGIAALTKLAWILLVGLGTLGVRAVLGYRRAHIDRDWQRTKHLYFQNLGNNASVLQLLVATVKHEELKEALLVYAFCHAEQRLWSNESELCETIEMWLTSHAGVRVDFDIDDALQKLDRLDLWRDRNLLRTVSPVLAIARLTQVRENRVQHSRDGLTIAKCPL